MWQILKKNKNQEVGKYLFTTLYVFEYGHRKGDQINRLLLPSKVFCLLFNDIF